mmetsp:Transcript_9449/g.16092  ORF Transcript_9449/g.16092 Transcript_9449/m.16092 type:complete len:347 (-) Transcript_9449:124-1164(-)
MMNRLLPITVALATLHGVCDAFVTNRPGGFHAVKSYPTNSKLRSQILDFIEPSTGVQVKLIGAMHYNPASIQLATDTINQLEKEGKLGSIIIESCDIRWNATLENEFVQDQLMSEMRAAHDLGLLYERPVVLGDQRINITVSQLKNGAKEAVLDLVQPWNGGWNRLYDSVSAARKEAVPMGEGFLGIDSFFDPKLMTAAPVSLLKYPLSYFVRSPVFSIIVLCFFILSGGVDDANALSDLTPTDLAESIFFSALETVIFARIFLKELIAERNEILAENIFEQCRNYAADKGNVWDKLFQPAGDKSKGAIYAPDSVVGNSAEEGKVVVAVLGLAHCNGIKKIMTEGK